MYEYFADTDADISAFDDPKADGVSTWFNAMKGSCPFKFEESSITDKENELTITTFPNPFSGQITFEIEGPAHSRKKLLHCYIQFT